METYLHSSSPSTFQMGPGDLFSTEENRYRGTWYGWVIYLALLCAGVCVLACLCVFEHVLTGPQSPTVGK